MSRASRTASSASARAGNVQDVVAALAAPVPREVRDHVDPPAGQRAGGGHEVRAGDREAVDVDDRARRSRPCCAGSGRPSRRSASAPSPNRRRSTQRQANVLAASQPDAVAVAGAARVSQHFPMLRGTLSKVRCLSFDRVRVDERKPPMATWEDAHWESSLDSGVPRSAQRSGSYQRYVPDLLDGVGLAVDGDVSRRITAIERSIRPSTARGRGPPGIARFLRAPKPLQAPGSRASRRLPNRSRSRSWASPRRFAVSANRPSSLPTT